MEIKLFPELKSALAKKANQFRLENFYRHAKKTAEHLTAEDERFCRIEKLNKKS
jgi:hypothetical protein